MMRRASRPAAGLAFAALVLSCAAAGASRSPDGVGAAGAPPVRGDGGGTGPGGPGYVRARGDRFEIVGEDSATPVFFRGVNLGAAPPGRFPGEFAIDEADYRRWIRFARDLHANAIRLYTVHPPTFYRVLAEENAAHPEAPLWLFQEIWAELPAGDDFWDSAYLSAFEREIRTAVDALHGNADVPARPGRASGRYDADVSRWIAGWLLGREWEPYAVRETERAHPDSTRYLGAFLSVENGTPMETWLARVCDTAARHERERYGLAHAVSFVNWPTLDPMRHPTETERGGAEAEHDEDAYSVDPTHIRPAGDVSSSAGFLGYFADYHVYPYYPDFMNLDPTYGSFRDRHGTCRYAGYLADLKAHTRGLPLLIGEYGTATSRGIAHLQPEGIHHGGASEEAQGLQDVRLLEDIAESGASGSLLFSLFDEWFKVNWLVRRGEWPRERDPLWHNLLDPEECYGLISFDPPSAIHVDGDLSDWNGIAPYASADSAGGTGAAGRAGGGGAGPLRALYAASDQARFYLRIDLDVRARARDVRAIGVAIDVIDAERGNRRLPPPLRAVWSRGAERVLLIEPALDASDADPRRRAAIFCDAGMRISEYSRVREGNRWEIPTAPYRPAALHEGRWVPMILETNRERVSRDGHTYPARHLDAGRLSYGREPGPRATWDGAPPSRPYDPAAEWYLDRSRGSIEVAIPWGLLGVGDPSSRAVIDDRDGTPDVETTRTPGLALLAWATSSKGCRADSLGPSSGSGNAPSAGDMFFLGPPGTRQLVVSNEVEVVAPKDRLYVWNGWEMPITQEHIKTSARRVREAFEGMEARETQNSSVEDRP